MSEERFSRLIDSSFTNADEYSFIEIGAPQVQLPVTMQPDQFLTIGGRSS